jgi:DNA-binding CsgD family transcriptional regulator
MDAPDFDADDLARLRLVHPHIATALKRFRRQLKERSVEDRISALIDSLPVNATMLIWDLRITHQNTDARRLSARWSLRGHESLPRELELPDDVLAECEHLKEAWRVTLQENPSARLLKKSTLVHPSIPRLSVEITLVLMQDSVLANPGFLVHFLEDRGRSERADGISAAQTALSPAEREAALLAAAGNSNVEIAAALGISVAAVKLRLHSTFKKLNIRNRTQLVVLLR